MSITLKKPPMIETVGAQHVCFNSMDANNDWTETFETAVEKTEVVKSVTVTETVTPTEVYASGKIYDAGSQVVGAEIDVNVIAFPADTLARMRGETVGTNGLVLSGGSSVRPFFAYGKTVKMKNGEFRFEWYPKCKLVENSDEASTSEGTFSEKTSTVKIKAMPFNAAGNIKAYVDTTMKSFTGLTEDKFFAKPILTDADLQTAIA